MSRSVRRFVLKWIMIEIISPGWKHKHLNFICRLYDPAKGQCGCGRNLTKNDLVLLNLSYNFHSFNLKLLDKTTVTYLVTNLN